MSPRVTAILRLAIAVFYWPALLGVALFIIITGRSGWWLAALLVFALATDRTWLTILRYHLRKKRP